MHNKKLNPGSIQTGKLIAGMPETKEIAASIQFRNDLLEPQKEVVNIRNGFDRLHGTKRLSALRPNAKTRMKELPNKARQSLNTQTHAMYKASI